MTDFMKDVFAEVAKPKDDSEFAHLIRRSKELLAQMTAEQREAMYQNQRESFVRGICTPCEHGNLDFEQCSQCRADDPLTWPDYYIGLARHAALKSKDTTKVGAILVGPDGEVRLTGFNGIPRGVQDLPERMERPAKYEWTSHAEANLIAFAAREGIRTKGCTVYVTHQPCAACSRTLIQAGISKVLYAKGQFGSGSAMPAEMQTARTMFSEAGIDCLEILE